MVLEGEIVKVKKENLSCRRANDNDMIKFSQPVAAKARHLDSQDVALPKRKRKFSVLSEKSTVAKQIRRRALSGARAELTSTLSLRAYKVRRENLTSVEKPVLQATILFSLISHSVRNFFGVWGAQEHCVWQMGDFNELDGIVKVQLQTKYVANFRAAVNLNQTCQLDREYFQLHWA